MFAQCRHDLQDLRGRLDVILCYSVLHYILLEARSRTHNRVAGRRGA
jgi:hypothetical protein